MINRLFDYVEIKTKITTTGSFLLAIAYLLFIRQPIDPILSSLFFVSMITMDLGTTAINNYIDKKRDRQDLPFPETTGMFIIFALMSISVVSGLFLVFLTDMIVLVLGALCFVCGVIYTWGPIAISQTPLGELFSGIFQGFVGPFILLYICMPDGTYLKINTETGIISVSFMVFPLITVILLTTSPVCAIANIMLANNICDVEQDSKVGRFTLPYYLKEKALYLFAGLYYCSYVAKLLMVLLGMAPYLLLLSLITIIPVQRNINKFFKLQKKDETFFYSIINYFFIVGTDIVLFSTGALTG